MTFRPYIGTIAAGFAAGSVTGLFGAGGGMVLIPLLTLLTDLKDEERFPCSIAVILPVCTVSLFFTACNDPLPWSDALPWLAGSALGGILAGILGPKIPTHWLHSALGILILWGGWRYLWH